MVDLSKHFRAFSVLTFCNCRIILVLGCLMMVGSYYCFDIPAALKTQIDDYFGNPSDYEFNFSLLYTLYAAPNVCLLHR